MASFKKVHWKEQILQNLVFSLLVKTQYLLSKQNLKDVQRAPGPQDGGQLCHRAGSESPDLNRDGAMVLS